MPGAVGVRLSRFLLDLCSHVAKGIDGATNSTRANSTRAHGGDASGGGGKADNGSGGVGSAREEGAKIRAGEEWAQEQMLQLLLDLQSRHGWSMGQLVNSFVRALVAQCDGGEELSESLHEKNSENGYQVHSTALPRQGCAKARRHRPTTAMSPLTAAAAPTVPRSSFAAMGGI